MDIPATAPLTFSGIVTGRTEPVIYAFMTNEVPNALKVGDTGRPILVRIDEWKKKYTLLDLDSLYYDSARFDDTSYFRDHSVHLYLKNKLNKYNLIDSDFRRDTYSSSEFFRDTTTDDVKEAISAIKSNTFPSRRYFHSVETRRESPRHNVTLNLRKMQQDVVDNFTAAISRHRVNLLMYAVMRFGKTVTALSCAKSIGASRVLIVTGKLDPKSEWQDAVEKFDAFREYTFADIKALKSDPQFIPNNNNFVLFLSLQDIQGSRIKLAHRDVFTTYWDLIIVDETHFGARGDRYGYALKNTTPDKNNSTATDGIEDIDKRDDNKSYYIDTLDQEIKQLKGIKLHLSGTPYRILYENKDFRPDDIISFIQSSDIAEAKEDWDHKHLNTDSPDAEEWDNPYFGLPKMIRFAFTPNQASIGRIEQLKAEGYDATFASLFKTYSEGNRHKFIYEKEILNFLQVLDGREDDTTMLGFLNNAPIKEGRIGRHIVMVLPNRAPCDALYHLVKDNAENFDYLKDYEIINIAGYESPYRTFSSNDVKNIKSLISNLESQDKKTISLTVNRMLTGTTVPEWDTMLFLKNTHSPEEYDQAIFRLQSPFVREYVSVETPDENSHNRNRTIKINKKPETLVIDFDPLRTFEIQKHRSTIASAFAGERTNANLDTHIAKDLKYSPIIYFDSHQLHKVTPASLMDEIMRRRESRSLTEEAETIVVDAGVLDESPELRDFIATLSPLKAKNAFLFKPHHSNDRNDGDDLRTRLSGRPYQPSDSTTATPDHTPDSTADSDDDNIRRRIQTFYARILYFALLCNSRIHSLHDIIHALTENSTEDNQRISRSLGLSASLLQALADNASEISLRMLDDSIRAANRLGNSIEQEAIVNYSKAIASLRQFSQAEVITPPETADRMVASLPEQSAEGTFLDIASKTGEFAVALYKKYKDIIPDIKDKIYSLCTSPVAYEFTLKTYRLYGLNTRNIINGFYTFDLIKNESRRLTINPTTLSKLKQMNIGTIIGNPPYHLVSENTSDTPIYSHFIDISSDVSPISNLITPGRFLFQAGKTSSNWNKSILNNDHIKVVEYFENSSSVFGDVDLKGGLSITLYNRNESYGSIGTFTLYPELNSIINRVRKKSNTFLADIVYAPESYKFNKTIHETYPNSIEDLGKGHLFDITTNIFDKIPYAFSIDNPTGERIGIFGRKNSTRVIMYIDARYIASHDNLQKWKVILPKSNGSGKFGEILTQPMVVGPGFGHSQTYISLGALESEFEADSILKYLKTRFLRTLLGSLKVTQDNKKSTWANVPMMDFTENSEIDWTQSVNEIDRQLWEYYKLSDEEIDFIKTRVKEM